VEGDEHVSLAFRVAVPSVKSSCYLQHVPPTHP
jgi:hypothetical protein